MHLVEKVDRSGPETRPDLRRRGLHPDFWYPVARGRDVVRERPHQAVFAGQPIVLVRTDSGMLFALEDRCAHRQVPLHKGVVKGDKLQCNYHCWTYDATGRCVTVPYLDAEKTREVAVRSFPVREAHGHVFVFPGDPARAGPTPIPAIPYHDDPRYKTRYLDRRVGAHWSFMHENLMDMNHQFLHRRLMGKIRATLLDVREGPDWVEADYTFKRLAGRQSFGEKFIRATKDDLPPPEERPASQNRTGGAPVEHDLMTIRTGYPYQTLRYWTPGAAEPAMDLWNCYIPLDADQTVNRTYGMIMVKRPRRAFLLELFWPAIVWFTEGIFREDKEIVEQEQAAWTAQGEDLNNEVFAPILALRRVLRDCSVPLPPSPRLSRAAHASAAE